MHKLIERVRRSRSLDDDVPVGVANRSVETQLDGEPINKGTKSHTLHRAVDDDPPSDPSLVEHFGWRRHAHHYRRPVVHEATIDAGNRVHAGVVGPRATDFGP